MISSYVDLDNWFVECNLQFDHTSIFADLCMTRELAPCQSRGQPQVLAWWTRARPSRNGAKLPQKMIFPVAVDLTKSSLKIPNFYNRSNIIENQPKNNFDYL